MKPATITELKRELHGRSPEEVIQICLRLAKFKKDNKELLTYLLLEADDEVAYIQNVKEQMDEQFEGINRDSYYFIKKSARKILSATKKQIRYSGIPATEVELLLYFSDKLNNMDPTYTKNRVLVNMQERNLALIERKLGKLVEDLQYDFSRELERVTLESGL